MPLVLAELSIDLFVIFNHWRVNISNSSSETCLHINCFALRSLANGLLNNNLFAEGFRLPSTLLFLSLTFSIYESAHEMRNIITLNFPRAS